jgi:hypothetical protein
MEFFLGSAFQFVVVKENFKTILRIYLCGFKGAGLILSKKKGVI